MAVINTLGVNGYKTKTQKVKNLKQRAHLKVKRILRYSLIIRYQLANSQCLTTNQNLVNQGDYITLDGSKRKMPVINILE